MFSVIISDLGSRPLLLSLLLSTLLWRYCEQLNMSVCPAVGTYRTSLCYDQSDATIPGTERPMSQDTPVTFWPLLFTVSYDSISGARFTHVAILRFILKVHCKTWVLRSSYNMSQANSPNLS